MLMAIFITVTGKMIKLTDMVFTTTLMAQNTKGSGLRISNTAEEKKFGQTTLAMRESTKMERNTVKVSSTGLMAQPILETLSTTTLRAEAFTLGVTAEDLTVSGLITRCTEKVCSPGLTVDATKVHTLMTRSKVTESSPGLTIESMKVSGRMVNNTVLACTTLAKVRLNVAFGAKVSARSGLKAKRDEQKYYKLNFNNGTICEKARDSFC